MQRISIAIWALLLAAPSWTQCPPPPPHPKITIGDGSTSSGTFNGMDQDPFQCAVDALVTGGQIEILPGTYSFTGPVTVPANGIRIHGSKGALIQTTGSLDRPLFDVSGADFVLEGLELLETRATAIPLVLVGGDRPIVRGSSFEITTPVSPVAPAGALKIAGASPGSPLLGALVEGCSFLFASGSAGRIGLLAEDCRGLRVIGNRFAPEDPGSPATVQGAAVLRNAEWTAVTANTFSGLENPGSAEADTILFCDHTAGEAGHIAIVGNVFADVRGESIVTVEGDGFSTVTGNVFGRKAAPGGALRLDGGSGNVVSGNQFHASTGSTVGLSVFLAGGNDATLSSNTFLDAAGFQVQVSGTAGVTLIGNRFEAPPPGVSAAIDLGFAQPAVVGGCVASGFTGLYSNAPISGFKSFGNLP